MAGTPCAARGYVPVPVFRALVGSPCSLRVYIWGVGSGSASSTHVLCRQLPSNKALPSDVTGLGLEDRYNRKRQENEAMMASSKLHESRVALRMLIQCMLYDYCRCPFADGKSPCLCIAAIYVVHLFVGGQSIENRSDRRTPRPKAHSR